MCSEFGDTGDPGRWRLLFGCIACAYAGFFVKPLYTSSSMMLVLTKETTLSSLADLQIGSQLDQGLFAS